MPDSILINLGCGDVWHEAWINFDLAPEHPSVRTIDLNRALPVASGSADAIYHAHVLEHLDPVRGRALLAECFRVLRPGGVVRIVVPDLEGLARAYLDALDQADDLRYEWAIVELIDQMVRTRAQGEMGEFLRTRPWRSHPQIVARIGTEIGYRPSDRPTPRRRWRPAGGLSRLRFKLAALFLNSRERAMLREAKFRAQGEVHRWMYDRRSLARLLQETGFNPPVQQTATASLIPDFSSYQLDTTVAGELRHPDSLFVEAAKPQ